jgi:hypothetical protein
MAAAAACIAIYMCHSCCERKWLLAAPPTPPQHLSLTGGGCAAVDSQAVTASYRHHESYAKTARVL